MIKLQSDLWFLLIELLAKVTEFSVLSYHLILPRKKLGKVSTGTNSLLSRLSPDCLIIRLRLQAQKFVKRMDPITIRNTRYLSVADSLVAICVTRYTVIL
jgi:hypothetical protein